jgi:hypothetical protein
VAHLDNARHDDAERIGQTRMITLITPVRPGGSWWLRFLFAVTRPFPALLRIGPMKVVHFTHWSLLRSIPYNGAPQLRERIRPPLLLWSSVYNGEVDPYIEAFVATVKPQIRATWGTSYDFPGVTSVTDLSDYIEAASWRGSYAYSAYPDATVRTILSAMTIKKEHAFLRKQAEAAADDGPDAATAFTKVYEGFLQRCQGEL